MLGGKPSAAMKQLKFDELLLHLLEQQPWAVLSLQTGRKLGFDDVAFRMVIETNITNNLTLEEFAFLCNTSLSTFKRRFVQIFGASPNKWMVKRRMEIAATLLQNQKERPSDVYYKVGYENHSSFSESFKQVFGITPREYQVNNMTA